MTHPQRNSLLCPNCRKLISGSEPRCPYCGLERPNAWWKRGMGQLGLHDPDALIRTVIFVNVAMYLLALLFNPRGAGFSMNPLTFLSPDDRSLILLGMTGTVPIDRFGRWWSILSANYLHGSILHIFFNMAAFRQLAPLVIREYGTARTIAIYTIGGCCGFAVSYLAGVAYTIGASAAVCSLIGAALYFGKSRGGIYGQAIYRQVGGWAIGLILFGLLVPGINNWGHIGGGVAGALLGMLLGYQERRRENRFNRLLAGVCISLTIAVLGYAALSSLYYVLAT